MNNVTEAEIVPGDVSVSTVPPILAGSVEIVKEGMSAQVDQIFGAIVEAQKHDLAATKNRENTFHKSDYADLAAVWEVLRKAYPENDIAILQFSSRDVDTVFVTTMLAHKSGQWVTSTISAKIREAGAQAVGAAVTYLRRYGLGITGVVSENDDDGEKAMGRSTEVRDKPAKPVASGDMRETANKVTGREPEPSEPPPTDLYLIMSEGGAPTKVVADPASKAPLIDHWGTLVKTCIGRADTEAAVKAFFARNEALMAPVKQHYAEAYAKARNVGVQRLEEIRKGAQAGA